MKCKETILKEYGKSTNKFLTDEQIDDLRYAVNCKIKKHRKMAKENSSDDLTYEPNLYGFHKSFSENE